MIKKERYRTGEKALSKEECGKLIGVIDKLEDEVMIKLAVTTGARREDLVNIAWDDVDEELGCISFQERKKRRVWKVFISPDMIQLLKKYRQFVPNKQKTVLKYCGRTAYNRLNELCTKANIPQRPFHALKATCIKFCQLAGWTPEQTAKHVGDTISVIQEHYSTPSEAEMREAVRKRSIL